MEQDLIGQQLGNYQILSTIGAGGYATVYLGRHIILKTEAAIKVLNAVELTEQQQEIFLKEARTIARLSHPHIIRLLECSIEKTVSGSRPYIVMSFAPQGSLRQRYPRGTHVPFDVVVSYTKQIADALDYAHNRNPKVIHCDVKPENLLLASSDNVLLSDFGIAGGSHTEFLNQPELIRHSTEIKGTPTYMAPERFEGTKRRASDQYALGAVVYEWLTGEPLFTGHAERVIYQHMSTLPSSLCEKNSHIPPQAEQVVLKSLAKDPEQRYATVKDFATELEKALLHTQVAQTVHTQVETSPAPVATLQQPAPQPVLPRVLDPQPVVPEHVPLFATVPAVEPAIQPAAATPRSAQPVQALPVTVAPPVVTPPPIIPPPSATALPVISSPPVRPPDPLLQGQPQQPPAYNQQPGQQYQGWGGQPTNPDPFYNAATVNVQPPPPKKEGAFEDFAALYTIPRGGLDRWLDPRFAKLREHRWFRRIDLLALLISTLLVGLAQSSWYTFALSLLILPIFWLCIRVVNRFLAGLLGIIVAIYWGWAAWAILEPLSRAFPKFPPTPIVATVVFIVALVLHIRYVNDRLP